MARQIQYIIGNDGQKKTVIVPVKQREDLNEKYEKLAKEVEILTGLQDAVQEVKKARKSGKKLQSFGYFLDESRD